MLQVPQIKFLRCPDGYCSGRPLEDRTDDVYHLNAHGEALPGASPGVGVAYWDIQGHLSNNTWQMKSCSEDSNRDPSQLLCGWCREGYSQSFPGTKCIASSSCNAWMYYPIILFCFAFAVVIYCLSHAKNVHDTGQLMIVIYFYQLAPSFQGPASSSIAGGITSYPNGLAMFNAYASTSASASTHSSSRGHTFGVQLCLYPGFSMVGKMVRTNDGS